MDNCQEMLTGLSWAYLLGFPFYVYGVWCFSKYVFVPSLEKLAKWVWR